MNSLKRLLFSKTIGAGSEPEENLEARGAGPGEGSGLGGIGPRIGHLMAGLPQRARGIVMVKKRSGVE